MTRTLLAALALGLLVGSTPHSTSAGGALIETTAPLADRSEESVKAAMIAAIDKAVRGAAAMGFEWFQLRDAQVAGNEVAVQILATDGPADELEPDTGPDPGTADEAAEEPTPEPPVAAGPRIPI